MRAPDKASVQSRRPLESVSSGTKPLVKKKFISEKLLKFRKFKPTISKEKLLPRLLIANKRRAIISAAVLGIFVIAGGGFGYYEYLLSQNPAVIYAKKLHTMTDQVSQQVTLPSNEQPTVATVSDVTKLPKEAFFQKAQDGDKILMYKKDKKAILYRPGTGQVITIAVLNFEDATPTPAQGAGAVAGASTSAQTQGSVQGTVIGVTAGPASPAAQYVPQGKILIQPH